MPKTDTARDPDDRPRETSDGVAGIRGSDVVEPSRTTRRARTRSDDLDILTFAKRLVQARRLRQDHVRQALLSEPAWDMLLELLIAHLENRKVSVSSLSLCSPTPPTTALRYITLMERGGEIIREPDPLDGRRHFLRLSPNTLRNLEDCIRECATVDPV